MHVLLITLALLAVDPISPGDHVRTIEVDGRSRSYLVHVPESYKPTATPVVLVFHGAGTNAQIMVPFCGMSEKNDEAGFIAVYPNGTGNRTRPARNVRDLRLPIEGRFP